MVSRRVTTRDRKEKNGLWEEVTVVRIIYNRIICKRIKTRICLCMEWKEPSQRREIVRGKRVKKNLIKQSAWEASAQSISENLTFLCEIGSAWKGWWHYGPLPRKHQERWTRMAAGQSGWNRWAETWKRQNSCRDGEQETELNTLTGKNWQLRLPKRRMKISVDVWELSRVTID